MSTCSKSRFKLLALALTGLTPAARAAEKVEVSNLPTIKDRFQYRVVSSYRMTYGRFDPYGAYSAYPDGASVWSYQSLFNIAYRFSKAWEADFVFSLRHSEHFFPSGNLQSSSIGDPGLETRYHFDAWAHFIGHLGLSLPFKASTVRENGDPGKDLADDNGDGTVSGLAVRAGLGAAKTFRFLPLRIAIDVLGVFPIARMRDLDEGPADAPEVFTRRGNQLQLNEGLAYLIDDRWSLNAGFKQTWTGNTVIEGATIDGTASRNIAASAGVSYALRKSFKTTLTYESPFPFYAFCANQAYSKSVALGLSYTGL